MPNIQQQTVLAVVVICTEQSGESLTCAIVWNKGMFIYILCEQTSEFTSKSSVLDMDLV